MLRALVGSKSAEKVLLFLLVNESCYAHQLSQSLDMALTPLQKALSRLENGSILSSYFEGKRKIYCFDRENPFIDELESLLRKIFNGLAVDEKKGYYYMKYSSKAKKVDHELLELTWKGLKSISRVKLAAQSGRKGWSGKGEGSVEVINHGSSIEFIEQGTWHKAHDFNNHFRFSYKRSDGMISLEHLRFGASHPVFLFNLIPTKPNLLESIDPHLCGQDSYFGWLHFNELFLQLHFRTIGPKKNEKIESIYT